MTRKKIMPNRATGTPTIIDCGPVVTLMQLTMPVSGHDSVDPVV